VPVQAIEETMNDEELSAAIRNNATRHVASERLRAAVVTQIALQTAARDERPGLGARLGGYLQFAASGGRGLWVGLATGALLTMSVGWFVSRIPVRAAVDADFVQQHVRAMGAGPLFDVASTDRHAVKPWFQGKLDYAPEVVDVSEAGFPLLGGRIDSIKGRPTAALVYGARQHLINVFELPSDEKREPRRTQYRGFNIVQWSDGAMQVWVVSDLDARELDYFALAWASRAPVR
jgi:anti-sigma factor RsiW